MNTNDSTGDDRPDAVVAAERGTAAWRAVFLVQRSAAVEHADWYAITGEVVDTLRCLAAVAETLAGQIAGYGEDRTVYDDEPGQDPALRLAASAAWAWQLRRELYTAEASADRLWSQISHIGVTR